MPVKVGSTEKKSGKITITLKKYSGTDLNQSAPTSRPASPQFSWTVESGDLPTIVDSEGRMVLAKYVGRIVGRIPTASTARTMTVVVTKNGVDFLSTSFSSDITGTVYWDARLGQVALGDVFSVFIWANGSGSSVGGITKVVNVSDVVVSGLEYRRVSVRLKGTRIGDSQSFISWSGTSSAGGFFVKDGFNSIDKELLDTSVLTFDRFYLDLIDTEEGWFWTYERTSNIGGGGDSPVRRQLGVTDIWYSFV